MFYREAIAQHLNLPEDIQQSVTEDITASLRDPIAMKQANDPNVTDREFMRTQTGQQPLPVRKPTVRDLYDIDAYEGWYYDRGEVPPSPEEEHGWSRIPDGEHRGLLLKDVKHPTFGLSLKEDRKRNMGFYRLNHAMNDLDGRLFTLSSEEYANHQFASDFELVSEAELEQYRWQAYSIDELMNKISKHEGFKPRAYNLGPARNIGYGHNFKRGKDSEQAINEVFPHKSYAKLVDGTEALTELEAKELLLWDIKHHINRAEDRYPLLMEWASSPIEVYRKLSDVLIDAVYESGMGTKTDKLIRAGDYRGAANEVLDRKDYNERKAIDDARGESAVKGGFRERWHKRRDALLAVADYLDNQKARQERMNPTDTTGYQVVETPKLINDTNIYNNLEEE